MMQKVETVVKARFAIQFKYLLADSRIGIFCFCFCFCFLFTRQNLDTFFSLIFKRNFLFDSDVVFIRPTFFVICSLFLVILIYYSCFLMMYNFLNLMTKQDDDDLFLLFLILKSKKRTNRLCYKYMEWICDVGNVFSIERNLISFRQLVHMDIPVFKQLVSFLLSDDIPRQ